MMPRLSYAGCCIVLMAAFSPAHTEITPAMLDALVVRYNKQTPRLLGKNVREEPMYRDGKTLIYTYRRLTPTTGKFRRAEFEASQHKAIAPKMCNDPYVGRTLRAGVSARFIYLSSEGAVLGTVQVSERDCGSGR